MAAHLVLLLPNQFHSSKSIGAKRNAATPDLPNLGAEKLIFFPRNNAPGNLFSRGVSVRVLSSVAPSSYSDEIKTDNGVAVPEADNNRVEFSRVNCLVWVLHESAASFSHEVESLDLEKSVPELAFAWNGKDVHAWHKRIAHHVAVYALMRTIIEMELLLSHDRHSNGSPVKEILAPNMKLLGDYIESQLGAKHPELAEWFREVELPRVTGFFVPFLKKWSMEYAGSGVAGIILAISGCAAVHADTLATLGLFAYLGRKTRLFLTKMGIKDLDEQLKDFLSYLECGSLFIYPEIGHVSNYQCFIEVVTDEIGWLEFYAASSSLSNQERKRSKQHAVQAEQEIILSTVFTVCYDVFSGFAHFSRSTQKPLDAELLEFLFRSQSLLAIFLEDYRAAYGRFGEPMKIGDSGGSDYVHPLEAKKLYKSSQKVEDKCAPSSELRKVRSRDETKPVTPSTKLKPSSPDMNILSKYRLKFMSKTVDVLMGTQLLVDDIMGALDLIGKQFRGQKISKREKKRLERTMKDVASLVPITILMLIPVSAVGHAAMLTAIQRYAPSLIPSPYSCDRLDMVKQLKRTKKLEVESWGILEDLSPGINREDTSYKRP
ncbi:Mitochondrial distribution and morphology protein 38 [Linum perenne]